jgi:hypothetical protein
MKALRSSETSFLTSATPLNIQEDGILQRWHHFLMVNLPFIMTL